METTGAGIPTGPVDPWVAWFRQWVASVVSAYQAEEAGFVDEILRRLEPGLEIEDPAIGKWYARAEAADWGADRRADHLGVRFSLDRRQGEPSRIESSMPLQQPVSVQRMVGQAGPAPEALTLIFNFSNALPVPANLQLFREFAVSQIKRLRPSSESGDQDRSGPGPAVA